MADKREAMSEMPRKDQDRPLSQRCSHTQRTAKLNEALQNENPNIFLLSLREAIGAQGGLSWLADATGVSQTHLNKVLATGGDPEFFELLAILKACGLKLSFQVKDRYASTP